jgi:ABC-type transporter Mla subunit MlaD
MIAAQASRVAARRRRALHVTLDTHVRQEAQLADDHRARINEALEKLRWAELRQVGYKTVL